MDHLLSIHKKAILFHVKPPARGAYAQEGKVKILTAPEKYASPQLNRFHMQRGEHFTGQVGI